MTDSARPGKRGCWLGPRSFLRLGSWYSLVTGLAIVTVGASLGCNDSGATATHGGGASGASGGALGTGGGKGVGGATGSGGVDSDTGGGRQSTVVGTGGAVPPGGTTGSGGSAGTGGATAAGGAGTGSGRVTGGAIGRGGTSAAGGTTGTRPSGTGGAGGMTGIGGAGAGGATGSGKQYWIAPDGSDSASGTEAEPWKTLSYAHSKASAGVTLWVKPGTYAWSSTVSLSKSGTEASPVRVFAAPGDRPVFDFSGQPRDDSSSRGIKITGDYWHLKGIDVINAGDNCINVSGSHNTIEWVVVHGCCDTGLQISANSSEASDPSRAAYNTILNCDSYENYDRSTGGENADGFAPKLHIGPGNVFRGCRAWNNCDDGWDLFAADDVVVIENCWAFLNGVLAGGGGTSNGDGNGFKLGGAAAAGDPYEGGAPHQVKNCFACENTACGYTRNNNTSVPVLTSSGGRANGKGDYCSLSNPSPVSFTMTGAQAKAIGRNPDGSLPAIQ